MEKIEEQQLTPEQKVLMKKTELLKRIINLEGYRDPDLDSCFNNWKNDIDFADDKELATAFKDKVRDKKKDGSWTAHFLKVCEVLGIEPQGITVETKINDVEQKNEEGMQKIKSRMERFLENGISKKEFKKLRPYRNEFPDLYTELSKKVK